MIKKSYLFVLLIFMSCNMIENDKNKTSKKIAMNSSFYIEKKNLSRMKREGLKGSMNAAFKVYNYYEFFIKDKDLSLLWLRIAAENGNVVAMYNFAYSLFHSKNKENVLRAYFWANKAKSNGDKDAIDLLEEIKIVLKK